MVRDVREEVRPESQVYFGNFSVNSRGFCYKKNGLEKSMGKLNRRNPKGDGGKGTGKKMSRQFATNVTTIYDMSRQFATFYDNFRLFIPLT